MGQSLTSMVHIAIPSSSIGPACIVAIPVQTSVYLPVPSSLFVISMVVQDIAGLNGSDAGNTRSVTVFSGSAIGP